MGDTSSVGRMVKVGGRGGLVRVEVVILLLLLLLLVLLLLLLLVLLLELLLLLLLELLLELLLVTSLEGDVEVVNDDAGVAMQEVAGRGTTHRAGKTSAEVDAEEAAPREVLYRWWQWREKGVVHDFNGFNGVIVIKVCDSVIV